VQATKQQQIIGYFIEEAKEHLDTIEQGLLDLKATMADAERLNELFRAAHSIKGGAAMLGFDSIQKVGHYLEDNFKLLKDHPVEVDRQIENLFFQGFDVLKELVEALQSPYGLREDEADRTLQAAAPAFTELQAYLNRLAAAQSAPTNPTKPQGKTRAELAALLNATLKKMLTLFKQGDTLAGRKQLAALCVQMVQLHSCSEWHNLMQTAHRSIANPRTSYQALAPLLIKELKLAGDLLIAERTAEIFPSRNLQQLAFIPKAAAAQSTPTKTESAAASASIATPTAAKPQTLTIPAEPRAAARVLLSAFSKEQLIELAEFLMKAIQ
jgi:chemotaxis protein histidine kinase CheA